MTKLSVCVMRRPARGDCLHICVAEGREHKVRGVHGCAWSEGAASGQQARPRAQSARCGQPLGTKHYLDRRQPVIGTL